MMQLNLRLPEELRKMAERYARLHGYKNIQELAKESIRRTIIKESPEGDIVEGRNLLKELDKETVKAITEIPERKWRSNYYKLKESERRRLKLLTRVSSSKEK